jgi:hypothetical protein
MADRYWVGGSAAWDTTVGTKWATASGVAGGASIPTAADNVFLDAASGAVSVSVTGSRPCLNLNCTGFTGTLTGSATPLIAVSGTAITLGTGMTFAATGPRLQGQVAATITLTTNGHTIRGITVGFAGCTMLFADNVTSGNSIILTSGTINANNKNVTTSGLASSGSIARTLNMGNGAWTFTGNTATLWDTGTSTNLTYTAGSATITFLASTGGVTYVITPGTVNITNAVTIGPKTGTARVSISGTFGTVNLTGPVYLQLIGAMSITGGTWTGTRDAPAYIKSDAVGVQQTLTTSGAVTGRNVYVADIVKAGAGSITLAPALDLGNNSGITFRTTMPKATLMMAM